jgi:hypothetical protein
MKKLEEMTIFELKEYREILVMLKDKYAKECRSNNEVYDYVSMFEEVSINDFFGESSKRFNYIQSEIENVDKIIEKIVFSKYDKKNK